jgi:HlyD family secretion protein
MKKKILIGGISLVVLIAAYSFYRVSSAKKNAGTQWETTTIQKGELIISITATGELEPLKTVSVGTQVSGVISELNADFNSHVKKGDVIARLDTRTLKAQLSQADADLQKAKVQLDQAQREFNRTKNLFEQNAVAQVDYDNALATYETAKANLVGAQVGADRAKVNLDYGTITAPIDGVIISRSVDEGQTVAASFNTPTLFEIANDLTKMQIEASVDEADIGQVKLNQRTVFTVDAFPDDNFEGLVSQIRLKPTTTNNVVTYTVIIDVHNPDMKLMPGMTANLTIYVEEHKDVFKVPVKAITYMPTQEVLMKYGQRPDSEKGPEFKKPHQGMPGNPDPAKFSEEHPANNTNQFPKDAGQIWKLEKSKLVMIPVKKGLNDGQYLEISGADLKEGDTLVIGMVAQEKTSTENARSPFMPGRPGGSTSKK